MKTIFKYVAPATLLVALCVALVSFTGIRTERVRGNGQMKSETRTAGNFDKISTGGVYHIELQQGGTNSISIDAEENLLPYIETRISGGELEVYTRKGVNIDPTQKIIVHVTVQQVKKLSASGACSYTGKGRIKSDDLKLVFSGATHADLDLSARNLEVGMSGASRVDLKGNCEKVAYRASGAANIDALDFQTDEAEIGISGSGEAKVAVAKKLNVSVSGVGKVRYKGNPAVSQSVSGMGNVRQI
ncbi:Putative auto-transporter adhesin, head GIN domain [Chitinophaga eiseniae]|uniref:Putative auto-transporter adhesin, head GIN domain n=1 Tax=Chitinophaga eiseniae TaxID=634771 RepID=A0A1T4MV28_9BACT|nr:head GIN domain-containing protein [Chitinophaga eiseniae]SJZ70823.1 Putative auto-transporter adhesin, head GIN domain [Chitinophaga eiseniae]